MLVYIQTGANVLETMEKVRAELDDASVRYPQGVQYTIPCDTTDFISASIEGVVHTLLGAVLLVLIVVFVFSRAVEQH